MDIFIKEILIKENLYLSKEELLNICTCNKKLHSFDLFDSKKIYRNIPKSLKISIILNNLYKNFNIKFCYYCINYAIDTNSLEILRLIYYLDQQINKSNESNFWYVINISFYNSDLFKKIFYFGLEDIYNFLINKINEIQCPY